MVLLLSTKARSEMKSATAAFTGITYNSRIIDSHSVFYREAGSPDAPAIVLLHGFPSSSRMWERLMPSLAEHYHVIAPDYIGFGWSDAPAPAKFAYTFDNLANIVGKLTEELNLSRYVLVLQDYGGPVGFRLALAHPERVRALILQNAAAYDEALGPLWDARKAYWADPAAHVDKLKANFLSLDATRLRHIGKSPHQERYDPDAWADEFAFLSRPGQADIQVALFYDYRTNVAAYPAWQAWLRTHKPPLLVTWGRYDPSFEQAGAGAFKRDVPDADINILDAGHFPMDEAPAEVTGLTLAFLQRLKSE
jgi:pimeloyl-ACP methyl ester carboxylesterase